MSQAVSAPAGSDRSASVSFGYAWLSALAPGLTVGLIWLATLLAALFAPDLVSAPEGEHVPLAAIIVWPWAAVATGYVLMAGRVRISGDDPLPWAGFTFSIGATWFVVALASIFAPEIVTGTDPTRVPIAVIIAPVAGTVATGFFCLHTASARPRRS